MKGLERTGIGSDRDVPANIEVVTTHQRKIYENLIKFAPWTTAAIGTRLCHEKKPGTSDVGHSGLEEDPDDPDSANNFIFTVRFTVT